MADILHIQEQQESEPSTPKLSENRYHKIMLDGLAKKNLPEFSDFTNRVAQAIIECDSCRAKKIHGVANILDVPLAEMQGQLKKENTNFKELLSLVSFHLAIIHIIGGDSAEIISYSLGYSERKQFEEAFKRWSKLTMGKFVKYYNLHTLTLGRENTRFKKNASNNT